jgi:hypothetical protein
MGERKQRCRCKAYTVNAMAAMLEHSSTAWLACMQLYRPGGPLCAGHFPLHHPSL